MSASTGLGKADKAALDMIDSLPDHTAKVAARGNLGKGVVAKAVAERLIADGKVRVVTGGRITTDLDGKDKGTGEEPTPTPVTPKVTGKDVLDAQDKAQAAKAPKVNGRKAKADASPYSTATPTNRIKRHGKSRRTGTMTEIEDGLAKGATFKVEGSGRYAVRCLTHKAETFVPDMTTAKPLQARTDQFCTKCATLVKAGEKHQETQAAQAS